MQYLAPTSSQLTFTDGMTPELWNQCVYIIFENDYSFNSIREGINEILRLNDVLRMRPDGKFFILKEYHQIDIPSFEFDTEEELRVFLKSEIQRDLSKNEYLFFPVIVRVKKRFGVVFIIHHALVDGYSFIVLHKELKDFLEGKQITGYSFKCQMEKEMNYRESGKFSVDAGWWNNKLTPMPEVTCFDHKKRNAETETMLFPTKLMKKMERFCEKTGISETAVLNAILAVFIYRNQNTKRFTIGVPTINRTTVQDMQTVGLFMHILPLVIDVDDDTNFRDLTRNISEELLDLYRHSKFTAFDIQKNCLNEEFLYKNIFDITSEYAILEELEDSEQNVFFGNELTSSLEVHFFRKKNGIYMIMRKRVEVNIGDFITFAEKCLDNSETKISEILCDRIPSVIYGESCPLQNKSLYMLVEEQSHGKIKEGENEFGISKLKQDAEKIDKNIRGKKRVIAIICDRSYLQLTAIYGVIRGGNAYMPISPTYPDERINVMLEASRCDTVLIQRKYKDKNVKANKIIIEDILKSELSAAALPVLAAPEDTLYVIFTSGSTGTPKGAMVTNSSAVNRITWMTKKYFDENTVVMLKTPYTFDVSVWEIFGFAIGGFSLYILPSEDHYNQKRVIEHIIRGQVTDIHFVPTIFRMFLDQLDQSLPSLKNIFLSGEAASASLVNKAPARVHNLYGPTECAVDVTAYDCLSQEEDPVPIGKPIDNCCIYILDEKHNPVPRGIIGEIAIGGTPVGEGYINNQEKTKSSFIDKNESGKIYLTGDFGYIREDGNVIYIGRNDEQIKINGQRIELGEIETALMRFVPLAVVIAKEKKIVAFYTGVERTDLRYELEKVLPMYMIPNYFVRIDKIPVTQSGKTDRRALPDCCHDMVNYEAPQSNTEEVICRKFSEKLKIEKVGRNDSFYDIGGTSILMMELLCDVLFRDISSSEFMKCGTPARLAEMIEGKVNREVVIPLYKPAVYEKGIVLFSYGGGDASAYTALVAEFKHRNADTALFYVPWHVEYSSVEREVRRIAERTSLSFYSHCAGAVTAMKLLERLNRDRKVIKKYYAAAIIPPKETGNIWHQTDDHKMLQILNYVGMPILNEERSLRILKQFRADTDEYFEYFEKDREKTDCSVELIISKADIFTANYGEAETLWKKYFTDICGVRYLDNAGHYFLSTEANQIADILLEE